MNYNTHPILPYEIKFNPPNHKHSPMFFFLLLFYRAFPSNPKPENNHDPLMKNWFPTFAIFFRIYCQNVSKKEDFVVI